MRGVSFKAGFLGRMFLQGIFGYAEEVDVEAIRTGFKDSKRLGEVVFDRDSSECVVCETNAFGCVQPNAGHSDDDSNLEFNKLVVDEICSSADQMQLVSLELCL